MEKVCGVIAIMGRPNVGKSSLFNRLSRTRSAIISDKPGTTRDLKKSLILLGGHEFWLIDTGGLDGGDAFFLAVSEQSWLGAREADLVLFVVDGKLMPDDADREIFYQLFKQKKPTLLVVNKIDNAKDEQNAWGFASFGAKEMACISVAHNQISQLERAILNHFELDPIKSQLSIQGNQESSQNSHNPKGLMELKKQQGCIHVGIIGRVNVGKSSLLNAIVGEYRALVSEVAGTTLDPVDEHLIIDGQELCFVDTAGLRRRGKIEGVEKFALARTKEVLSRADIAILVLDASAPFVELDEKIAGLIDEFRLGVIVVFNKWDIAYKPYEQIKADFALRFKFLEYAPIITVCAKSKKHVHKLKGEILAVYERFGQRIPTARLNDLIAEATTAHPIPSHKGKLVKIYYATQFSTHPPCIALVMNKPYALHFSYKRYLVNFFRRKYDFRGTKIYFSPRQRGEEE